MVADVRIIRRLPGLGEILLKDYIYFCNSSIDFPKFSCLSERLYLRYFLFYFPSHVNGAMK